MRQKKQNGNKWNSKSNSSKYVQSILGFMTKRKKKPNNNKKEIHYEKADNKSNNQI